MVSLNISYCTVLTPVIMGNKMPARQDEGKGHSRHCDIALGHYGPSNNRSGGECIFCF